MELLTVDETAQLLRVSSVTVRRFIARGELRSLKVGRQRRVDREAVECFIRGNDGAGNDLPEELRNMRPLEPDDPFFGLVGMASSLDGPTDVSSNKHKYLAEAYLHTGEQRVLDRRGVLVDTSGFFAMNTDRDANHRVAAEIAQRIRAERLPVVTTNFVLAESHALHLTRLGRDRAWEFLRRMDRSGMTIVRLSDDDERKGRTIIDRYRDKAFSLTDATSFAVMKRLGIRHVFTFDRHFAQYGFTVLQP